MKKVRILMIASAFAIATCAAFATKATNMGSTYHRQDPADPDECIDENVCVFPTGSDCGYTVFDDNMCKNPVVRKKQP